jgi:hypothetical protein
MELWNSLIEEEEPITLEDIKTTTHTNKMQKKQLTLIMKSILTTKEIFKNKL